MTTSLDAGFATDEAALAYANGELDKLVAAMRRHLASHVAGWPLGEDRERNTYEALRHLLRNVSFGHAAYVEGDYENPTLTKMSGTSRVQYQLQSPDCNYHAAMLHGDYRYRLRGYRGTAAIFQAQTASGHGYGSSDHPWKVVGLVNNFDHPAFAAGKTIDVVLSKEKPADLGDAYWMPLADGPSELHLRQYYGDWETEQPADLILTHEGQTFPSKLLTKTTSEERFSRLGKMLDSATALHRRGVQGHLDANPDEIDEVPMPGAFEGTAYFFGHFRCGPDEAAVIDIDPSDSLYWNLAVNQMQWEAGDYWAKLVSYNMTQVRPESDGSVRLIASWTDPGVPNWLDCSGRNLHLIGIRLFRATRKPKKPRVKTVPLAELANHIPEGTPRVTPQERHDLMTRRLVSVYRRRFNDF